MKCVLLLMLLETNFLFDVGSCYVCGSCSRCIDMTVLTWQCSVANF